MLKRIFPALALLLAATACSDSGGDPVTTFAATTTTAPAVVVTTTTSTSSTTSTTVAVTTTTIPPVVSPLNGLPVTDEALADRRVLAVKIDNHCNARPQSGLQDADAVYELQVESPFTRFIALFHDNDSDYLGPIRSGRPTDPTLIRFLGATFVNSGGQSWVQRLIANSGVQVLGETDDVKEAGAQFRIPERRAPHNLYGDTEKLQEIADSRDYADDPPIDLFAWGEFESAGPADVITIDWYPRNKVVWEWNGEAYIRNLDENTYAGCRGQGPHELIDADGVTTPVEADTLVILGARHYTAFPSGSGSAVPALDTLGEGPAYVFAGGGVATGTWQREEITDSFTLTNDAGEPISVPPGMPWISIVDQERDVTWE